MPFDPTKPAAAAPLSSAEMRGQLNALRDGLSGKASEDDCVNRTLGSARNPAAVAPLGLMVSAPPTQAEVQALADKLEELLAALQRP